MATQDAPRRPLKAEPEASSASSILIRIQGVFGFLVVNFFWLAVGFGWSGGITKTADRMKFAATYW
jgi:hypothetical protein